MKTFEKTFKYRLYPTKPQERFFGKTLNACRWVYNKTLETRKTAWEERQETLTKYDTNAMIPKWKATKPSLKIAYSQSLQDAQKRVDLAFQGFFRRVKRGEKPGYPRFKGEYRYDSWTYPQAGYTLDAKAHQLALSRIGNVKIKLHRPVEGVINTLTVRKSATGKWYACFTCAVGIDIEKPVKGKDKVKPIGIDLGVFRFATASDGKGVKNPRFIKDEEKALAKAQRRFAAAKKEVTRRGKKCKAKVAKLRRVIARVHERLTNRRNNFVHKLSRATVNRYPVVVMENLNVGGMLRREEKGKRALRKAIIDASWKKFLNCITYKAEWAGGNVILVNPKNTSKKCSRCSELVEKDLGTRVHRCTNCGLVIDRDVNAARNILALGLQSLRGNPLEARLL